MATEIKDWTFPLPNIHQRKMANQFNRLTEHFGAVEVCLTT